MMENNRKRAFSVGIAREPLAAHMFIQILTLILK